MKKKMNYSQLRDKQQKEFSQFPIAYAFSDKQLKEALAKLGAALEDCCSVPGGGIIKKTDKQALTDLFARMEAEMSQALEDENFLLDALVYELENHEFAYTGDPTDALNVLGLTRKTMTEKQEDCFSRATSIAYERAVY